MFAVLNYTYRFLLDAELLASIALKLQLCIDSVGSACYSDLLGDRAFLEQAILFNPAKESPKYLS